MLIFIRKALSSPGGVLLLALGLRLVLLLLTTGADYDITSYHLQAESVRLHRNVYLFTERYPYPPVWVWLAALADWTATQTLLPFGALVKVPGIAGDCLIVWLLWREHGAAAAWFYALNPVALLISAGHGQFDGLVLALVVLAWVWLRAGPAPGARRGFAALALGGAIALKGYPVLFLPAFLLQLPHNRQRLALAALALVPLALSFLVYGALFGFAGQMLTNILLYSSSTYFGWSFLLVFVLKIVAPAAIAPTLVPLGLVARAALVAFACWLPWRWRAWPVERLWLVTLLGFYALAPGISVQYLLWAVPLFALIDVKSGWKYTACSTLVAVFYYLTLFPGVLPLGGPLAALAPLYVWLVCYVFADAAWWVLCLRLFRRALRWSVPHSDQPQAWADAGKLPV